MAEITGIVDLNSLRTVFYPSRGEMTPCETLLAVPGLKQGVQFGMDGFGEYLGRPNLITSCLLSAAAGALPESFSGKGLTHGDLRKQLGNWLEERKATQLKSEPVGLYLLDDFACQASAKHLSDLMGKKHPSNMVTRALVVAKFMFDTGKLEAGARHLFIDLSFETAGLHLCEFSENALRVKSAFSHEKGNFIDQWGDTFRKFQTLFREAYKVDLRRADPEMRGQLIEHFFASFFDGKSSMPLGDFSDKEGDTFEVAPILEPLKIPGMTAKLAQRLGCNPSVTCQLFADPPLVSLLSVIDPEIANALVPLPEPLPQLAAVVFREPVDLLSSGNLSLLNGEIPGYLLGLEAVDQEVEIEENSTNVDSHPVLEPQPQVNSPVVADASWRFDVSEGNTALVALECPDSFTFFGMILPLNEGITMISSGNSSSGNFIISADFLDITGELLQLEKVGEKLTVQVREKSLRWLLNGQKLTKRAVAHRGDILEIEGTGFALQFTRFSEAYSQ